MSYPPRPPMGMPPMLNYGGVHHGMGGPPPMMQRNPPFFGQGGGRHPHPHHFLPSLSKPPMIDDKPRDHPLPYPQACGPAVTVFVGNITEKWPDPMIRQLLATCGQVINWKRVQGASGRLQGFGFCEFNGPDAGLRAVRLLHDLEVADKKLVVKVDAKTNSVLESYKAEKRSKKLAGEANNGSAAVEEKGEGSDYMDSEMKEFDQKSKQRIDAIFNEFKSEIEAYISGGSGGDRTRDAVVAKQQIQDKLHLLKLSSIDATLAGGGILLPEEPDLPEEIANDEGKRVIITREISIFRESMKHEQEREEERKRLGRERREKERDRDDKQKKEKGTEDITSPDQLSGRDRRDKSGSRDLGNRGRRFMSRENMLMQRNDRNNRDNSRKQRGRSKSRSPDRVLRSPGPVTLGVKPRYREREEEEEQTDQKRLEKKAREKEQAYELRLRQWEAREAQKGRENKKARDRIKRQEEELQKEARKMKQFLEDYDDEKDDFKFYRGKELQKRLADRARELEEDNKDRQREREELEEMKLRMMTSSSRSTPNSTLSSSSLLDKYKKPTETTPTPPPAPLPLFTGLKLELKPSINSRLQVIANNQANQAAATVGNSNQISSDHKKEGPVELLEQPFLKAPVTPNIKPLSTPTTPISLTSPAQLLKSPSIFTNVHRNVNIATVSPVKREDDESRHSFSSAPSPGLPSVSPTNFSKEGDDSSVHSPLDAPKRKKMDIKDIFNQDEDDGDGFGLARKRKLVPLDFGEEAKKLKKDDKNPEEKKKNIKALIDKIPTDKDALFAYEIDWEMVDTTLMEKRIRPWINKKIVEYIGEPEPTLVDFICSKVLSRSAPRSILEDVLMVLDEEAEVFVVKMWRLLVYEIEAKKYGLAGGRSQ